VADDGVHVFWDGNNIFGGAERAAKARGEPGYPRSRVYFKHLAELVLKGRPMRQGWMNGNIPPPTDEVWTYAERLGFKLALSRRTDDGREGRLDETLREKMLATFFDYSDVGTIAVLTGDGAGHHESQGFFANMKRLNDHGWDIEPYSWDCQCHGAMREWAKKHGTYTALEDYFESVTFLKPDPAGIGERKVESLEIK